jgi:hypothetical protein
MNIFGITLPEEWNDSINITDKNGR